MAHGIETQSQELGLSYTSHQYGSHNLQRLATWEFTDGANRADGYWVIFIHGGAWRDPRQTSKDFWPTIRSMVSSRDVLESDAATIRGFASLDYRLSPHPEFPQDPSTTPESDFRGARHPDHLTDVHSALTYMQVNCQLDHKYILVGHSAGATLAYQLLMGDAALNGATRPSQAPSPAAIISTSGIFDLVGINARHDDQYAGFITGAFSEDRAQWANASPACFAGDYKQAAASGVTHHTLAWSTKDTLIDEPEIDTMAARLQKDGVTVEVVKDDMGDHDDVWMGGVKVADLIRKTLDKIKNTLV